MSTYAAIFMQNPKTGLYSGLSVKYDGYIHRGVGECLHKFWREFEDVKALCFDKRTDMRVFSEQLFTCEWFSDETTKRYIHFKKLTREKMLSEGKNIGYVYIFEPYGDDDNFEWFVIRSGDEEINMLSDFF